MTDDSIVIHEGPSNSGGTERRDDDATKAWFRTPSNTISLAAVAVTALIFVATVLLGKSEERARQQQQVGQLIEQISALAREEAEVYGLPLPPLVRTNAFMSIANRRLALIGQVESLLDNVAEATTRLDLALLATTYAAAGLSKKAEPHLLDLASAEDEQIAARVMAWRSLVALYGQQPHRIDDAMNAAVEGMSLLAQDDLDAALRTELFAIPYSLAIALTAAREYGQAIDHLIIAEKNAWDMPCYDNRSQYLALVQVETAKLGSLYPEGQRRIAASREDYSTPCAGDQAITTAYITPPGNDEAVRLPSSRISGTYQIAFHSATIEVDSFGNVGVTFVGQPTVPAVAIGEDLFASVGTPASYISFQRDEAGNVTHLLLLEPGGRRIMHRR